jgi:hypothetical protein
MRNQEQIRKQHDLQVNRLACHGKHGTAMVRRPILRAVRHLVLHGEPLAALSTLSSGGRAHALLSWTCAVGLRALGLTNSAQVHDNSPLAPPLSRCGRSRKSARGSARSGQRRQLGCERSPKTLPKMPAARTAPDHRPCPRFARPNPAGGRARCRAWSTASLAPGGAHFAFVRWGALLLLPQPAPFALGRRIAALRCLGAPARIPGWGRGDAYQKKSRALAAGARQQPCTSSKRKLAVDCERSTTKPPAFKNAFYTIATHSHDRSNTNHALTAR